MRASLIASGAVVAGGLGLAAWAGPSAVAAVPFAAACAGGAFALGRLYSPGGAVSIDASLAQAMPDWSAGRRAALEGMVAEVAGPTYGAHALRCATLADLLAEQLALTPEESAHVTLAAAVHVLPVAYPASEDAEVDGCEFPAWSLEAARAVLARTAPPEVARMAFELRERWDGTGIPGRLQREAISMGGRIIAAACVFDHASAAGLESGLDAVRKGSANEFDPVVVAELLHLFREPWQHRVAA